MAIATRISEETYEQLALSEPDRKWELRDGVLREKPAMTSDHNWLAQKLGYMLLSQLDWSTYQVRTDAGAFVALERPTSFRMSLSCPLRS